jgi:hypothetical protein
VRNPASPKCRGSVWGLVRDREEIPRGGTIRISLLDYLARAPETERRLIQPYCEVVDSQVVLIRETEYYLGSADL